MRFGLLVNVFLTLAFAGANHGAPPVELELATERGVQITAPHAWLQLLTAVGIDDVQIRGKQAGDELKVVNRGTAERPRYYVLGFLSTGDRILLPGGTFTRGDRAALMDYFDRLATDGPELLTAPRGRFGLTSRQLATVTADLARPIDFETKSQPLPAVVDRLRAKFTLKLAVDAVAARSLRSAKPVADELNGLTAGTGLALLLRREGFVLRPEKIRGQPVVLRILIDNVNSLSDQTLGKTDDAEIKNWPIGWELSQIPVRTAPALFEQRNAEIDGYTLAETLAAIQPRISIPLYLDHAALAAKDIDPATIQVRLARSRTSYKRIIDRVLSQARLHSQLRVDEAGTPFLWITR
jgi:hypothetical protein